MLAGGSSRFALVSRWFRLLGSKLGINVLNSRGISGNLINDETGFLSQQEKIDLEDFVRNHLLSTSKDLRWLDSIKVREVPYSDYFGLWRLKLRLVDSGNPSEIVGVAAEIELNYWYVKFLDPQKRLVNLKKTLAHEYGHHWTLAHLIVNQHIADPLTERLPATYYQLRGLNSQDHACDISKGWLNCDKEIIAEDYRYLFAPSPHDQEHQMEHLLQLPDHPGVKTYIQNLNNFGRQLS